MSTLQGRGDVILILTARFKPCLLPSYIVGLCPLHPECSGWPSISYTISTFCVTRKPDEVRIATTARRLGVEGWLAPRPAWVISGHDALKSWMSALPPKADIRNTRSGCLLWAKSGHCAVHSMTSSALAIKPSERRSPCIGSRLDNSEKVQPALDAYTQVALTYAVRIQRNLRHRYHHEKRYKATTIPSPIVSHFIVSLLNVPMCFPQLVSEVT